MKYTIIISFLFSSVSLMSMNKIEPKKCVTVTYKSEGKIRISYEKQEQPIYSNTPKPLYFLSKKKELQGGSLITNISLEKDDSHVVSLGKENYFTINSHYKIRPSEIKDIIITKKETCFSISQDNKVTLVPFEEKANK
jgi:hypothetical protein